jgi:acetate kinase
VRILVINVGSTTVKYDLFDNDVCLARGAATRVDGPNAIERALGDIAEQLASRVVGRSRLRESMRPWKH